MGKCTKPQNDAIWCIFLRIDVAAADLAIVALWAKRERVFVAFLLERQQLLFGLLSKDNGQEERSRWYGGERKVTMRIKVFPRACRYGSFNFEPVSCHGPLGPLTF